MTLIIFVFGLVVGSFLNSVIYRLQQKKSFVRGRSACPHCQHQLSWFELLPLVSFIIQRGRCRKCQAKLDWQYPLVELATGLLFVLAFVVRYQLSSYQLLTTYYLLIRDWIFIAFLLVIFVYDLRYQLILDKVTLPAMALALIFNLLLGLASPAVKSSASMLWPVLLNYGIAAMAGGGFFLLQFVVSKGRWIGGGDIRLGILLGLLLGWPQVVWAVMLAYLLGAAAAVGLIIMKKKTWSSQIAFGTFLSLAAVITLFWGGQIINWYINLLS